MPVFNGDNGPNTLTGTDEDDILRGYGGRDVITDGFGDDEVYGGRGNDTIRSTGGSDLYNGGQGIDTLVVDVTDTDRYPPQSFEVEFDTVAGIIGARGSTNGQDVLVSIENLTFSGDLDVFVTCGAEDNVIRTGLGGDRIRVGGGDDRVYAGDGNDRVFGGNGDDVLNGGKGRDTLEAGHGDDIVRGGAGRDTLVMSGSGIQTFDGGAGIDTFRSATAAYGLGTDLVIGVDLVSGDVGLWGGHASNDTVVNVENVVWTGYNHMVLAGDGGANLLSSGSGDDTLRGAGGDDTLRGNRGADELRGGAGADDLVGGRGRDAMYAGNDAAVDTFVFETAKDTAAGRSKADRIFQFESGEDRLDFSGIDADSGTAGNQALVFSETAGAANAVWLETVATGIWVNGDTDGDGVADFRVKVVGATALEDTDFLF